MDNRGLKIIVAVLAMVFAASVTIAVVYKDDMDYKKAKQAGTKEAFATFVEKHPKSEFFPAAKHTLDSIIQDETIRGIQNEYHRIRENGNIEDYLQFLLNYPDCEYISEVQSLVEEWDELAYQDILRNYSSSKTDYYLELLPNGKHATEIRQLKWANSEEDVYRAALSQNNIEGYQQYIDTYPNGRHLREMRTKLAIAQELEAYTTAKNLATATAYREYLNNYPNGQHKTEIKELLDDIEAFDRYKDNSLANGAQPYSAYYGTNKTCQHYGCSEICVKAPYSSDVLVLVKKDNSNGQVIRHGYIKAGRQVCFEIPDGRYQVFFYYGKGWYPKKKMSGGIKGGFLTDEVFSKDQPQYLSGQVLTYELILQRNGNFSTTPSSENEMF